MLKWNYFSDPRQTPSPANMHGVLQLLLCAAFPDEPEPASRRGGGWGRLARVLGGSPGLQAPQPPTGCFGSRSVPLAGSCSLGCTVVRRVTSPMPQFRVKVPLVVLFVLIYSFHSANQTDFLFLFKYLYMCIIALCLNSLQSHWGNKEQTISVR